MLRLQIEVLFAFIYLSIAVRIAALARAVRSKLVRGHIAFIVFVCITLMRAVASVTLDRARYLPVYNATLWPIAIIEALTVVEAFWILASHFRKIRGFAWALVGLIAAVSIIVSIGINTIRSNMTGFFSGPLLFHMYTEAAFLTALLLSLLFFRQFRTVPIRPNAIRHVIALSIFFALSFASAAITQVTRLGLVFLANLFVTLSNIIGFGYWAIAMSREGGELPFEPSRPLSRAEFEAAETAHKAMESELKQAGEQAMRKAVRAPETSRSDRAEPPDPPEQAA